MNQRPIKFRAWYEDKMYFPKKFHFWGDGTDSFTREDNWQCTPAIFMQYTGLKDKNGKEIYEGDIVKGLSWKEPIAMKTSMESIYSVGGSVRGWGYQYHLNSFGENYRTYPNLNECEIIGNIYENPDLLQTLKEMK